MILLIFDLEPVKSAVIHDFYMLTLTSQIKNQSYFGLAVGNMPRLSNWLTVGRAVLCMAWVLYEFIPAWVYHDEFQALPSYCQSPSADMKVNKHWGSWKKFAVDVIWIRKAARVSWVRDLGLHLCKLKERLWACRKIQMGRDLWRSLISAYSEEEQLN